MSGSGGDTGDVFATDVLVIGGGLAGAWAAIGAARAGAQVTVAEKGYFGTSGVTATAGPGHWWAPPDPPEIRQQAIAQRNAKALGLGDPRWMARILDLTWRTLPTLAPYYLFPTDEAGVTHYRGLRGPEYLLALRRLAGDLGVRILDHHPALELIADPDGQVTGAAGAHARTGRAWTARAGAVVLATGGCAFKSRLLGAANNTGDGLLMGAEAGAQLSGMEFSCYYTVSPARSTMTRSMSYAFAVYFDAEGRPLDIAPGPDSARALAAALLRGPVFCSLERTPDDIREVMRQVQPNFMVPFDRWGIDPYVDRFEITLRGEGTVRGVGGLRIADDDCGLGVPGLYAAGDVASREPVAGATSGGGAQNSAWALSSGQWAGAAAAAWARRQAARRPERSVALGRAGLRPSRTAHPVDLAAVEATVREEMLGYDRTVFRTGEGLSRSLSRLDGAWGEVAGHAAAGGIERRRTREAAALLAAARWCDTAALARNESRGMHQRTDAPRTDPRLARRLRLSGVDRILVLPERTAAETAKEVAA
jgi:succinate dehydrogenase/fumarate reductase flavoprotein subunit